MAHNENVQDRIADEGALPAICQLAYWEDEKVWAQASLALGILSSQSTFHRRLIDNDAIHSLLIITKGTRSVRTQYNCATALANLACYEGAEARIGSEGALVVLLACRGRHEAIGSALSRLLLNLVCVRQSYGNIEDVIDATRPSLRAG